MCLVYVCKWAYTIHNVFLEVRGQLLGVRFSYSIMQVARIRLKLSLVAASILSC